MSYVYRPFRNEEVHRNLIRSKLKRLISNQSSTRDVHLNERKPSVVPLLRAYDEAEDCKKNRPLKSASEGCVLGQHSLNRGCTPGTTRYTRSRYPSKNDGNKNSTQTAGTHTTVVVLRFSSSQAVSLVGSNGMTNRLSMCQKDARIKP
jgi:hypothetical protein